MQEALARNAREIQALKEQYAQEMEQQRKRAELQQKQIEILQQTANLLAEQLKKQAAAPVSSQAIEKLETKTELLESRAQQAARRDQELASATDNLREKLDTEIRNGPRLPAPLKELFDGNYTNETPVSIFGQMLFGYNKQNGQNGNFTTMQVSPYFLVQLNKRFLVEASVDLSNVDGVGIGNAQIDILLNKWMTLNVGRFLTPIGQFNLWYNHEWVNRLADPPLMFNQVSPLTSTDGIQLSGATYLGALPVKFTYQLYFGNGFQVAQKPSNYSQSVDLGGITGGPEEVSSQAYGGRFGLWMPRHGLNMGFSGYSNGIYNPGVRDHFQLWGWDLSYHRGNWYFLTEFANNYQEAKGSIGNNIDRRGLYAQLSYRDYNNRSPYLAKLEYVFRYSFANFSGINFSKLDLTASSVREPRRWTRTSTPLASITGSMPATSSTSPTKSIKRLIISLMIISSWPSGPGSGDSRAARWPEAWTQTSHLRRSTSSRMSPRREGSKSDVCNSKDGGDGDAKPS